MKNEGYVVRSSARVATMEIRFANLDLFGQIIAALAANVAPQLAQHLDDFGDVIEFAIEARTPSRPCPAPEPDPRVSALQRALAGPSYGVLQATDENENADG